MNHPWITIGAVLGGVAVGAGAFGAHGLKAMLDASGHSATWETAARYAMYHGLALVALGMLGPARSAVPGIVACSGWCFVLGTAIFSGCLAALALTGLRPLGAVVPIGGVLLIAGWALFAVAAARG